MLVSLNDFDFAFTTNTIVLNFESQDAAKRSLIKYTPVFAKWARQFKKQEVRLAYPNTRGKYFPVLATMGMDESDAVEPDLSETVLSPGIHFEGGHVPMAVLKALARMQENPDEKWVLIKLSQDLKRQTQIAMSEACRSLVKNATLEQAIGRQRSKYWFAEDLSEMERVIRQDMTPNINDGTLIRFRGCSPVTQSDWRRFTYQYWNIDDGTGSLYQLGLNLNVESISSPV